METKLQEEIKEVQNNHSGEEEEEKEVISILSPAKISVAKYLR